MDAASMVVGALIFLWGWMIGRHYRLKAKPPAPEPWCLCKHAYGSHDEEHGFCHNSVVITLTQKNGRDVDERVPCSCKRYVGPDPISCGMWVGGHRELP